ncbi:unnamed protein product [Sphagnum balticum]
MAEYIAILDNINESDDDDDKPNARNVRSRTNFWMIGDAFHMRFRLSARNMQWLYERIGQHLQPEKPYFYALSAQQRLLVLVRFLSDGGHYRVIGDGFGIDTATTCRVVNAGIRALVAVCYRELVHWPVEAQVYARNRAAFYAMSKMPSTCDYTFYEAVVRWPGSVGDARILTNSTLYNRFENNNFRPFPGEHQVHPADHSLFFRRDHIGGQRFSCEKAGVDSADSTGAHQSRGEFQHKTSHTDRRGE